MTVSITITPGLEARLVTRARSAGKSLEGFIQDVLEREVAIDETADSQVLTGTEKAKAFRAWAGRHTATESFLYVDDEGPGIPTSERRHVFKPFVSIARDIPGQEPVSVGSSLMTYSGLGLYIANRIMEKCEGQVSIESNPARRGNRIVCRFKRRK